MIKKKISEIKNVVSQVYQGYTECSTGGCCGVSLPKEEQQALRKIKQQGHKQTKE
ncbi:MAG: hypothetical protein LKF74_06200 [Megasphaera sp.]|jgi:hypothetical protein|nr:hypothetical protein [Megasphaera sp.]MCH4218131.1 hypothetical protein [Megasphaera sp.]